MSRAIRVDLGVTRGDPFCFEVDGESVPAFAGETVAAALMAEGRRALRTTAGRKEARGYYCGMGVCWDCMMWLEGEGSVQTCRLLAEPGMRLRTMRGASIGPASEKSALEPRDSLG
jgi:D-hydroxyproline dehydrogenase subunit gamma